MRSAPARTAIRVKGFRFRRGGCAARGDLRARAG